MKKAAAIAVIAAIVIAGFGNWFLQNAKKNYAGQTESISIGIPPLESSALIYIAEDQHFFADNGLNVTVRVMNRRSPESMGC